MKKYIPHIVILIVGIVIGALCREHHFRNIVDSPQRDTIFVRDTNRYAKEDIDTKGISKEKPDTVYVPVPYAVYKEVQSNPDTIYVETPVYIPIPRQYYFSKVKDVEIYHSGIESRIDSLHYISTTANVYNTIIPKEKKHSLTIYGGFGYKDRFVTAPCGAKYLYHPVTWFGVGGKYEYDAILQTHATLATTEINFRW